MAAERGGRSGGGNYEAIGDGDVKPPVRSSHAVRCHLIAVLLFMFGCVLLSIQTPESSHEKMDSTVVSAKWNESLTAGTATGQSYDMWASKVWSDWAPTIEKDEGFLQADWASMKEEPEVRDRVARLLAQHFPYDVRKRFPRLIWQTWHDVLYPDSTTLGQEQKRTWANIWRTNNPTYKYELITDAMAERIVYLHYRNIPQVIEAYAALPHMILKADFLRYLVLFALGGVYSDVDTYTLKPIEKWFELINSNDKFGLAEPKDDRRPYGIIVGIEADSVGRADWAVWYARRLQMCQWTIMSKPGHPILRNTIAAIVQDTLRMKQAGITDKGRIDMNVMNFTGPARWTDEVFRHLSCVRCNEPNRQIRHAQLTEEARSALEVRLTKLERVRQMDDVLVLPTTSFSPGFGRLSTDTTHPLAFVFHNFTGSWKDSVAGMEPLTPGSKRFTTLNTAA